MVFKHCPHCGSLLVHRDLGDEKSVPWCMTCEKPWFPVFPVAIIALVYNDLGEVLLLRQNYISTEFHNLVSGYVVPGESAEQCSRREIFEETGIKTDNIELIFTDWFARKEMMMIGFFAHATSRDLKLSLEVDSAEWCPANDILTKLSNRPGATSRRLAEAFLSDHLHNY